MPPATPTASAPSLGRLDRGWVVASETAALDIVGASGDPRDRARRAVVIDEEGLRSQRFAEPEPKGCVFEYVYLARPDTTINGRVVHEARVEMGARLAIEHPVEADLVMPCPESGTPAAIGYAQESGIPSGRGWSRTPMSGGPSSRPRRPSANWASGSSSTRWDVIKGKRLVVVDDSIVRGNTQRAQVRMLREAGAAEVHVRISSPPVAGPASTASTSRPAPS
jgi:amidophosphoribosyltransferase